MSNDTGVHAVIEEHAAVFEVILEMDIGGEWGQGSDDFGEGKVVSGCEPDGVALEEAANDGFGTDAAVVRVGAAEDFIEEKEDRERGAGQFNDLFEARNFGVEA